MSWLCLILLSGMTLADDFYRVRIGSEIDAAQLEATGAAAVVKTSGGYLVLADGQSADNLKNSKLKIELLAANIDRANLAIDIDHDRARKNRRPALYEEDNLSVYYVSSDAFRVMP